MRTIKFRGKDRKTGKWFYGNLFDKDTKGNTHIGTTSIGSLDVIPDTVGQFTGLTDKNGKEIYEGDIIALRHKRNCKAIVVWIDAGFARKSTNPLDDAYYLTSADMERYEVIGNIHDNPELLKTETL